MSARTSPVSFSSHLGLRTFSLDSLASSYEEDETVTTTCYAIKKKIYRVQQALQIVQETSPRRTSLDYFTKEIEPLVSERLRTEIPPQDLASEEEGVEVELLKSLRTTLSLKTSALKAEIQKESCQAFEARRGHLFQPIPLRASSAPPAFFETFEEGEEA